MVLRGTSRVRTVAAGLGLALLVSAFAVALPGTATGAVACAPSAPVVAEAARGRLRVTITPCDDPGITGHRVGVIPAVASVPTALRDLVRGASSTVFTGMDPGQQYRFVVAPLTAEGVGEWSAPSAPGYVPFATGAAAVGARHLAFGTGTLTPAQIQAAEAALAGGSVTLPEYFVQGIDLPTWGPIRSGVIRLYQAYFLRLPDAGGLTFWADRRAAGWSLDRISANFAGSSEFVRTYGALSDKAFVDLVYENVLGRPPDAAGSAFWTGQLASGKRTRGRVMTGFSESGEYKRKTSALVTTVHLFTGMLGRFPTRAEIDLWVPQLAGGTPAVDLASWILGSTEYGPQQRCNGHAELCDRSFEDVSFATTHNAMTNAAEGWVGPNQEYGMTRQLTDGIRAMMLDTHYNGTGNLSAPDAPADVPLLCHGYCKFGWDTLTEGLVRIRQFLDEHPDEVVSIIFETYVSNADTLASFTDSGLLPYAYAHPVGQAWPTLREMVDSGERLVVLTDSGGGAYPWYLPVFTEAFDNPYSAKTTDDLTCTVLRGSGSNRLFILNNFLTDPVARRPLADMANASPFLLDQAQKCQQERGTLPNFVTVDFYDRGSLFATVDALNGV